jgi:hypothetical protein
MNDFSNTLLSIQHSLEESFNRTGTEIQEEGMERFNQANWINRVWSSKSYRRAHLNVVDCRESSGLWMMHCCIFPHLHNTAPIYGFDIVALRNKITGCFHDFSPTADKQHPMINWFSTESKKLNWNRTRELPDWAKLIFSNDVIAASNVQEEDELNQIVELVKRTTEYYLNNVRQSNDAIDETIIFQNYYSYNQKQNPHLYTPRIMESLGLDHEGVTIFVEKCLFPEIFNLLH